MILVGETHPATLRPLLSDNLIDTYWRVAQVRSASKRRW
jgi:hypothetical protein